jgi:hypothetical protein
VDRVSWEGLQTKIQMLQDFGTRLSCAPNRDAVRDSLAAVFGNLGLEVTLQHFGIPAIWYCSEFVFGHNVIATQPGVLYPDSIVIICAHYDSWSEDPPFSAPGADDNASGVAAVLSAAEVLSGLRFAYTIQYICFGGEEYGPYGSGYFARRAFSDQVNIVGAINLDMIGYWREGVDFDLEVEANEPSGWLSDAFVNAAELYTETPCDTYITDIGWSDNASFWAYGFPALNCEEAWDFADPDFNPTWHTTGDFIQFVHPGFTVANTRAVVAALATVARITSTVPTLFQSFNAWRNGHGVELAWGITMDTGIGGFNIYRSSSAHDDGSAINGASLISSRARSYTDDTARGELGYVYVLGAVIDDGTEVRSSRVEVPGEAPALDLGQNFPNPFNAATRIPYAIEAQGHVSLQVFDVNGRLVETLVNGTKTAGRHSAPWNGKDRSGIPVSSGVYVVRLEAGGHVATRKISLLK